MRRGGGKSLSANYVCPTLGGGILYSSHVLKEKEEVNNRSAAFMPY